MPGEDTTKGLTDKDTTDTTSTTTMNGAVPADDSSTTKDKVLIENEKNTKYGRENSAFVKERSTLVQENGEPPKQTCNSEQQKSKENGRSVNGNTKVEKGPQRPGKENGSLAHENAAFVKDDIYQQTPPENYNGHLPPEVAKEDLEMVTRKENVPMDVGRVEDGQIEEKRKKEMEENLQGQQEKIVTNGTATLLPPATGLMHNTEFANPAYEPEGQLIDYERANGTNGTNGTNGRSGVNGTKEANSNVNIYKEQKANNKDLPHKVTFTERRWCSCKRLLICIVVLAVLAGLAVAAYFLYKHFTLKKTDMVQSRVRLLEEDYSIDLEDFRSSRYITLSRDITVLLDKIFKNDETLQGEYNRCEIEKFASGSVWTEFNVIFNKEFDAPFLEKSVKSTLQNNIKGDMLGKFKVDKDQVETKAIYTGSPAPHRVTEASTSTSTTSQTTTTTSTTTEPTTPPTTTSTTTTPTTPTPTTTTSSTTPVPTTAAPACQNIWIPQCQDRSQTLYNGTTFPNPLGHSSQEEASRGLAGVLPLLATNCHPYARRMVCGVLVPQCIPGEQLTTLLPCKDLCQSVITKCNRHLPQSFIDGVDCDSLHASACIGAPPLSPPTLRLVDGAGPFEGRLEIQHGGEWGTVCDDGFDKADADVVCRQLGYSRGGIARRQAYFTEGQGQIWLNSVECEGSEPHLSECRHSPYGNTGCRHGEDAGVTCLTDNQELAVETRLVGGSGQYEGRVEVFYKNRWGPVCDDHFTGAAARTVCRALGISDLSAARIVPNSGYPASGAEIWLDNVRCNGSERSIALCGHNSWGQHDCSRDHTEDVAVSCIPPTTTTSTTTTPLPSTTQTSTPGSTIASTTTPTRAPPLEVRLVDGVDNLHGRLEIRQLGGEWGGVCDDGFGQTEAQVVCIMLGYMDLDVSSSIDPSGSSQLWLDDVTCTGKETTLADCDHRPWGAHNCNPSSEAVAISCGPEPTLPPTHPPPTTTSQPTTTTPMPILDVTVRVENGPDALHGLVVVTRGSQTGTICDDSFDMNEAKVICRMLGYNGTDITYEQVLYGSGTEDLLIILDDLKCMGNETTLASCSHSGWAVHNCDHTEDVGINCGPLPSTTTSTTPAPSTTSSPPTTSTTPALGDRIRLVGGMDEGEGALQLRIRDTWTPVCAHNLTKMDAITVCQTLGYNESSPEVVMSSRFERQNATLGVTCDNVTSCLAGDFVTTQCRHDMMTAISCVPQRIRLVTAGTPGSGRPEVFYQGQWGNICDDKFDNNDAKVVCHMLGYNGSARVVSDHPPSSPSTPTHLDELACIGNETSIFHCMHYGLGRSDCSYTEAVGVKCISIPAVPTPLGIRLADGPHPLEGRLEVFRNGTWGTVCENDFEQTDAEVACRMLNASGPARVIPWHEAKYEGGVGPIWLTDVSCSGQEMSLADCDHAPWGDTSSSFCYHTTDVSISCAPPPNVSTTSNQTTPTTSVPLTTAPPMPVRTRLIGTTMGRVEVLYNNTWGTICKDGINDRVARVVCSSLGFNNTSQAQVIDNTFPGANTSMPIHLDSVRCTGNETNLSLCEHDPWGVNDCTHREDVAMQCAPPDESAVVFRLSGGSWPGQGRLEVYYDGQWGSVCDDGFSDRSAQVACRQLGFSSSDAEHLSDNRFGAGPGMTWMSHVICEGSELNLLNCSRDRWGSHNCDPSEAVSIQCQTSGTASPAPSTTIRSPVPPGEMLCEEIIVDECKDILPYTYTALPNRLGHQTQAEVMSLLSLRQWHHLFGECASPQLPAFVCSLLLPDCMHIQEVVARKDPCKSLCKRAEETCRPQFGDDWPPEWDCDVLPEKDPSAFMDICFEGQTSVAGQCEPIQVPFCNHDLPYNRTQLPNAIGHQNQQKVQVATEVWLGVSDMSCHPKLRSLICALYTPPCPQFPGQPQISPCSTTCQEVREACEPHLAIPWPSELNCLSLPNPDIGQPCDTIQLPEATSRPTTLQGVANTTTEASTVTSPMETTRPQQATTQQTTTLSMPVNETTSTIITDVTAVANMTGEILINTTMPSSIVVSNTSTTTSIPPIIVNTTEIEANFTGMYTSSNVSRSTSSTLAPINMTVTVAIPTSENTTAILDVTSTMSMNATSSLANTTMTPTAAPKIGVNATSIPQNATVFFPNSTTESTTTAMVTNATSVTTEYATTINVTSMETDNVTRSTTPTSTLPKGSLNATNVIPTTVTSLTSENTTVVNMTTPMISNNVTTLPGNATEMSTTLGKVDVTTTVLPLDATKPSMNMTEVQSSTMPATSLNAITMPLNATMLPVNATIALANATMSAIETTTTSQNVTTPSANTTTLPADSTLTVTNVRTLSNETATKSQNVTSASNGNATLSSTPLGSTNATAFVNITEATVNASTLPMTTTEMPGTTMNMSVATGNTTDVVTNVSMVIPDTRTSTPTTASPIRSSPTNEGLVNVTSNELNMTSTTGLPINATTTSGIEGTVNATTIVVAQNKTKGMPPTTTESITKVPLPVENVTESTMLPTAVSPAANTTQESKNVTQQLSASTTEAIVSISSTSDETTMKPENTTSTTLLDVTITVNVTLSHQIDTMLTTNATAPLSTSAPTSMSPPSTLGDVTPVNVTVSGTPMSPTTGIMGNTTTLSSPPTSSMSPTVSPSVSSSTSAFTSASLGTSTSSGPLGETETMSVISGLNVSVSSTSPTGTSTELKNVTSTMNGSTIGPSPTGNVSTTTSAVSPEVMSTNGSISTTEASSVSLFNTTTVPVSSSMLTNMSDVTSIPNTRPGLGNVSVSTMGPTKATGPKMGNGSMSTTVEQPKNVSDVSVSDAASSSSTTKVTTEQAITPTKANLSMKSEQSSPTSSPSSSTTFTQTDTPIVVPGLNVSVSSTISTVENMTTLQSSATAQQTTESTLSANASSTAVSSSTSVMPSTTSSTMRPSTANATEITEMSSTIEPTSPKPSLSTSDIIMPQSNLTSTSISPSTVVNQTSSTVTQKARQSLELTNTTITSTVISPSTPATTTGSTSSTSVSTSTPKPSTSSTTITSSTETTIGPSTSGSTLATVSAPAVMNTTVPVLSETTTMESTPSSTPEEGTTMSSTTMKLVPSIPVKIENSTLSLSPTTTASTVTTGQLTTVPSAKPNTTTVVSTESTVSTTVTTSPVAQSTTKEEVPVPPIASSSTSSTTSTMVPTSTTPASTVVNSTEQIPPTTPPASSTTSERITSPEPSTSSTPLQVSSTTQAPSTSTTPEMITPPEPSSSTSTTTVQVPSTTQEPSSSTTSVIVSTTTQPLSSTSAEMSPPSEPSSPPSSTTETSTRFIITSTSAQKMDVPSTTSMVTNTQTTTNKTEEPTPPTPSLSTTVELTPIPVVPEATSQIPPIPTTTETTSKLPSTTVTQMTSTTKDAEPSSSSTPLSTGSSTTTQPSTTTSETTQIPSTASSSSTMIQSTSTTTTTTTVVAESLSITQSQPTSASSTTSTISSSSAQPTTTTVTENSSTAMPLTAESTTTIRQAAVSANNNQTSNSPGVSQPTRPSSTTGGTCSDLSGSVCASRVNYTQTGFPNFFNHKSKGDAEAAYKPFEALTMVNCSALFQRFTCSLYLPPCDGNGNVRLPCQSLCERVKTDCGQLLAQFEMDMWPPACDILPVNKCYNGTAS